MNEVVAHLADPFEVFKAAYPLSCKGICHVSRVHILHDERTERDSEQIMELLPDHIDNLIELCLLLVVKLDHLVVRAFLCQSIFDLKGPNDLRDYENDLAWPGFQPANTLIVQVACALTEVVSRVLH